MKPRVAARAVSLLALALWLAPPAAAQRATLEPARRALETGRAEESRETLLAWIESNPADPAVPDALLLAALAEERAGEAARRLALLANTHPNAPAGIEATLLLAESAIARGQSLGEADAERMRVLSDGRAVPQLRRRALALLAESAAAAGELAEARTAWRRLLDLDPSPEESAQAAVRLGAIEAALGRPEGAVAVLEEAAGGAAASSGAGAALFWNLAQAAARAGREEVAAGAERELAERFPHAPEVLVPAPAESASAGRGSAPPWAVPPGAGRSWVVRSGNFSDSTAADALRAGWEEASGERMQVVGLGDLPGRWAVETAGFPDPASAARFAQWLEAEGGYVSWVEAR